MTAPRLVVLLVTALLVGAATGGCAARQQDDPPADGGLTSPSVTAASCSERLTPVAGGSPSAGPFVPDGARVALLCVYRPDGDAHVLDRTRRLDTGVRELTEELNALPAAPPPEVCSAARQSRYRVLLEYPDREPVAVDLDPACGAASRGSTTRRLTSLRTMLARWDT